MKKVSLMAVAASLAGLGLAASVETAAAAGPVPSAVMQAAAAGNQVTPVQFRGWHGGPGWRGGWRPGYRWRPGYGWVPFAVGATIAGVAIANSYYAPPPGYYYGPGPYYYGPGPYYGR